MSGKSPKRPVVALAARRAKGLPFSQQPLFDRRTGVDPAENRRRERGTMKKTTWASAIALTAGLLTLTPSAAQADAPEVRNTSTISIGAVQVWSTNACVYRQGCYDALIPSGRFSGWPSTAAIWVGQGYCLRLRPWLPGYTEQNPPPPAGLGDPIVRIPPPGTQGGWHRFGADTRSWDVRALPLSDPGCGGPAPSAKTGSFFTVDSQTDGPEGS